MDVNASASASSSATSGAQNSFQYGDFIVGAGAKKSDGLPAWALVAIGGAVLIAVSLYLIRK